MTKRLCSALIVLMGYLFIFQPASAQSNLYLGVKGGISIPDLKGSDNNPVSKGWSTRLGPYAGIVGELKLSDKISIQGELNYSSQGGKKNGEKAISSAQLAKSFGLPLPPNSPSYVYINCKSEAKLNYIELPVLLK